MCMEVFDAFENTSNHRLGVIFGEFAHLRYPFEQLPSDGQLKRQIVLVSGFKPFVEFHLENLDQDISNEHALREIRYK